MTGRESVRAAHLRGHPRSWCRRPACERWRYGAAAVRSTRAASSTGDRDAHLVDSAISTQQRKRIRVEPYASSTSRREAGADRASPGEARCGGVQYRNPLEVDNVNAVSGPPSARRWPTCRGRSPVRIRYSWPAISGHAHDGRPSAFIAKSIAADRRDRAVHGGSRPHSDGQPAGRRVRRVRALMGDDIAAARFTWIIAAEGLAEHTSRTSAAVQVVGSRPRRARYRVHITATSMSSRPGRAGRWSPRRAGAGDGRLRTRRSAT